MSQIVLGFYGDDFSGSADVMEVLALAGVRTILFLAPPTREQLARFPDVRAVGIAGVARSLPTEFMEVELRPAFECLGALSPLVHYKICSTFDSSPEIGSIGRAIDLGQEAFGTNAVPVVVGAPALGRYCVFGNLFARSGGGSPTYRLDRHPTMSTHPITPMNEADLTRHLALQTKARIGLLNTLELDDAAAARFKELESAGGKVVLIDACEDRQMPIIGELIERLIEPGRVLFTVGSSGIEYALTAHWHNAGELYAESLSRPVETAECVLVVSGSCSPVTADQIQTAAEHGFQCIALPVEAWLSGDVSAAETEALAALTLGRSVIVHTALGPEDPRLTETAARLENAGRSGERNALLAAALAHIVRAAMAAGLKRCAVAGGDTSGYVARALGIEALEFIAPLAPGSPLCLARFHDTSRPDLQICFKGGQVGQSDFFLKLAHGAG